MVQRYKPDELEMIGMHPESDGDYVDYEDYTALEREMDELQAKVIEQDDKLCKAEKRLEVACHVKADDKVGFDFAVLDKIDSLERERDKVRNIVKFLEERLRHYYKVMEKRYNRIEDLESENALLRKRLEPIEAAHREYEEYPSSAIVKRDAYDKAINRCMKLKEEE